MRSLGPVVAMIVALAFAGCDLFTTRTPESPDLGSTFVWTPAATPNTLVEDFSGSLQAVDAANYSRCFVSAQDTAVSGAVQYSFSPRAGLDQASRSLFDAWTVQSEQSFLTKLRASLVSNPRLSVTLSNEQIDQTSSTQARIAVDYSVLLPTQTNSTLPSSIAGSLIFQAQLVTTEQGTKEWRIVSWSDFAGTTSAKTFTDLKVQLSS
ncbi:MAG: hypothetical protein JSS75_07920 [Bacteroidetes bacterium]|nr:hypothetical protein [Bacteroidota bacterium]